MDNPGFDDLNTSDDEDSVYKGGETIFALTQHEVSSDVQSDGISPVRDAPIASSGFVNNPVNRDHCDSINSANRANNSNDCVNNSNVRANNSNDRANNSNDCVNNSIDSTNSSINLSNNSNDRLDSSIDYVNNSINRTNTSINGTNNSIDSTNNSINRTNNSIDGTNNSINRTNNSIDGTNNSINRTNNSIDGTNNSINRTNNSIDGSNNSINRTNNSIDRTNNSTNRTNNSIDGTNNSINRTNNSIDGTNNSINRTNNSIDSTNNSINSIKKANGVHTEVENTNMAENTNTRETLESGVEEAIDESIHTIGNEKSVETSKEMRYTNENTFSDGYFDQSIDKIYERYNKSKCIEGTYSPGSSEDPPTGCFDNTSGTRDTVKQMSLFKRYTQKKYIVLSSTALCMLLAATIAVLLTVNVFHVTGQHRHYHGDAAKTAENSAEMYQRAAIASDSGNCSKVGVEFLRQNGSAVDAAIATAFCIGVTNRHASGIGGGGYMLIYNRENRSFEALDFREAAPGRIQSDVYDKDNNASRYGGMAIGIPAEVKGLHTAWMKYGKIPWKRLLEPAINLARNGVVVTSSVHTIVSRMLAQIQADPGLSKLFLNNNGDALEIGAMMIDKELAETLTVISENPEDFYTGQLAAKIVADITEAGGIVSFDDLARYRVLNRDIVHDTIDDFDLNTIGAPTGGPVIISLLNILKGYKMKAEDIESTDTAALTYHRIIEAMKFAFALKTKEGDPSFYRDYMKELTANMTNEEHGQVLRRKINDSSTNALFFYDPLYELPNENGTSHISVISENGDAVSLTTTINEWYGSQNRSLRTGIVYNNEMNDFSMIEQSNDSNITNLPPSPINSVRSGKRPVSSTAPIIMTDAKGDVRLVLGGAGGKRIIASVTQVIINKLWFKDELGNALNRPRVYNFLQPDVTYVEPGLQSIIPGLKARNHTIEVVDPEEYTSVQAISIEKDGVLAKSDKRKSGHTAGY